jgi:hypothetical protein
MPSKSKAKGKTLAKAKKAVVKADTKAIRAVHQLVAKEKKKEQASSSSSGMSIGSKVGSTIGGKVGGWVGDMASKALSFITGFGDYEVKENSIVQKLGAGTGQVPMFLSAGGCCRLSHREFLGLVVSPGGQFNITGYPINPFNSSTFPWLAEIAGSFESFRMKGMVVEFVSTYGDAVASTNAALGSVILATQYNTAAPPFSTQSQMENYQFATSCKPSVSMIHPIECDPSQLPLDHLYVFNAVPGSNDPRWSNLGITYLATVGQQAAATLGELWVSFDIEFYMPKLISSVSSNGLGSHYFNNSSLQPAGMSNTNVLPPNFPGPSSLIAGDLPLTPYLNPVGQIVGISFPPGLTGYYMVTLLYNVQGLTASPSYTGTVSGAFINASLVNWAGSAFDGSHFQPSTAGGTSGEGTISSGGQYSMTVVTRLLPTSPTTVSSINFGLLFAGGFSSTASYFMGIDIIAVAIPFAS